MRPATAILALLIVSACAASEAGPDSPGRGGRGRGGPDRQGLFISPAGQPFRNGEASMTDWFNAADADHDRRLTPGESAADHQAFFRSLDLDGDGILNGAEIDRYETQIAPEILPPAFQTGAAGRRGATGGPPGGGFPAGGASGRGGRGPGAGGGGGRGTPSGQPAPIRTGAAQFSLLYDPEPVRAADINIDFQVSTAEWGAVAQSRFALLDENHDGVLTLSELHWPRVILR